MPTALLVRHLSVLLAPDVDGNVSWQDLSLAKCLSMGVDYPARLITASDGVSSVVCESAEGVQMILVPSSILDDSVDSTASKIPLVSLLNSTSSSDVHEIKNSDNFSYSGLYLVQEGVCRVHLQKH